MWHLTVDRLRICISNWHCFDERMTCCLCLALSNRPKDECRRALTRLNRSNRPGTCHSNCVVTAPTTSLCAVIMAREKTTPDVFRFRRTHVL